jgi:hypothetical protein
MNAAVDGPLIDRPVFVVGTGRSGLTPLMDLIAYHPAFGWPSQYNERLPRVRAVSALSRIVDIPPFDSRVKFARGVPKHTEAYPLWARCFPGFAEPFRDLVAEDVTPYAKGLFRETVAEILAYQRKPRFIAEYSGWSRIAFLRAIFPDAKFIHIVRDGRAVAHSYTTVDWWNGWEGVHRWRLGMPGPELLDKLARYEDSFLALAAVYWKILVSNIAEKSRLLPADDFLLVRYEDLVEDPVKEAYRCIEFAGLDDERGRFGKHLRTVKIVDANRHRMRIPPWREAIDPKQRDMFDDLAGDELAEFGYA